MRNSIMAFFFSFVITITLFCFESDVKYTKKGSIDNRLNYDKISINNYFKEMYDDKFVSCVEDVSKKIFIEGCINLSQTECSNNYNSRVSNDSKKTVSGTCGIVAATMVIDYYGNYLGKYEVSSDYYDTFCTIMNIALDKNYSSRNGGLKSNHPSDLINASLKKYGGSDTLKSKAKSTQVRSKIKEVINDKNICFVGLTDHYVVCCGITSYLVKIYKNKDKKTYTYKTYDFFIINEGYGIETRSLFLTTNVANDYLWLINGMQCAVPVKEVEE